MSQLADWKSHKIVKAGKILAFPPAFSGPVTVEDANGAECKVDCPPSVFARGRPNLGDYIVIYDDGNIYSAVIATHAYSSQNGDWIGASPSYYAAGTIWLRVRLASGTGYVSFSMNGVVWTAEISQSSAITPAEIAVGRFLGSAASDGFIIDWFNAV